MTRQWRYATAVAVLAALSLVLAACGGGTDEAGDDDPTSLTMAVESNSKAAVEEALAAYKKEAPNVTIKPRYASIQDVTTTLYAQIAAGNAPDIFPTFGGSTGGISMANLVEADLAANLAEGPHSEWTEDIPDQYRDALGGDKGIYLWNSGLGVIGVVYNEDVLEEHDLALPKTWPELLETCDRLKQAGVVPLALGLQTPWITQLIPYALAPSIALRDPDAVKEIGKNGVTFSNSGWREIFERYLELNERGCFNDSPNGTTFEQVIEQVAGGKAAMAVLTSAIQPMIEAASKGRAKIGYGPFPATDDPDELLVPAGLSIGFSVSSKSKKQEAARKFLAWLAEPENSERFAKAHGQLPMDLEEGQKVEPAAMQPFVDYIATGRSRPMAGEWWPNEELQPTHFAVVQEMFAGDITVDEALGRMDEVLAQGKG